MEENLSDSENYTRLRKKSTCSYCGTIGHNIRYCDDRQIKNECRIFYNRVNSRQPPQEIVLWFMLHDEEQIRMLSYKLFGIPYHNNEPVEILINKIHSTIKEIQDSQKKQTIKLLEKYMISFTKPQSVAYLITHPLTIESFIDYTNNFNSSIRLESVTKFEQLLQIHHYDMNYTPFLNSLEWNTLYGIFQFIKHECVMRGRYNYELFSNQNRLRQTQQYESSPVKYSYCLFDSNENTQNLIEETVDCPICMENVKRHEISKIQCGHSFCTNCIDNTISRVNERQRCPCPICRTPINTIMRSVS